MHCEIREKSATQSREALVDCPHHCTLQGRTVVTVKRDQAAGHALHFTFTLSVAGSAPPVASAANSSADDAAGSRQPPAAAAGPRDVLSSAGPGRTKAASLATAAAGAARRLACFL